MYKQPVKSCGFYSDILKVIFFYGTFFLLVSCTHIPSTEPYGFITQLGNDTISVERVNREGNIVKIDAVDRFPRVRLRHTVIELAADGSIHHLVMNIHTPSEPENQRERKVIADVSNDSVHISKTDGTGTLHRNFKTGGSIMLAHVPQMYSLYELYFAAALHHTAASKSGLGTPVSMKQFYIDREFDDFTLGDVLVQPLEGNKATITHDWLSGTGEATMDSGYHMLSYSGARTTYKVEVLRLTSAPEIKAIADRYESLETKTGMVKQLSVRDTMRAQIGNVSFTVDYGRPLMRGRKLLGDVLPYDRVWRTGANAATQFTTSAPIKLCGMQVAAGKYTLWTLPHMGGTDLILNRQTGQWGTEYDSSYNLWIASMTSQTLNIPVEEFSISIIQEGTQKGMLMMEWGSFRWTAAIEVE